MSTKQKREFEDDLLADPKPETPTSDLDVVIGSNEKAKREFAAKSIFEVLKIQESDLAPIYKLSVSMAKSFIDQLWERNRGKKAEYVETYVEEMLTGQWRGATLMQLAVKPDGSVILYNGNHRCSSLIEAARRSDNPHLTIDVILSIQWCKDDDDIGSYYQHVDNPYGARVINDYNVSLDLEKKVGLPCKQLNALYIGIWKAATGFTGMKRSHKVRDFGRRERVLTEDMVQKFIKFYFPQVNKMHAIPMYRRAAETMRDSSNAIGVFFFLWMSNASLAQEYIVRITEDPNPEPGRYPDGKGDPVSNLVTWMMESKSLIKGASAKDWLHVISKSWNVFAFQRGIPGKLAKSGKKPREKLAVINYTNDLDGKGVRKTPCDVPDHINLLGTQATLNLTQYREMVGNGMNGRWQLLDLSPTSNVVAVVDEPTPLELDSEDGE